MHPCSKGIIDHFQKNDGFNVMILTLHFWRYGKAPNRREKLRLKCAICKLKHMSANINCSLFERADKLSNTAMIKVLYVIISVVQIL